MIIGVANGMESTNIRAGSVRLFRRFLQSFAVAVASRLSVLWPVLRGYGVRAPSAALCSPPVVLAFSLLSPSSRRSVVAALPDAGTSDLR